MKNMFNKMFCRSILKTTLAVVIMVAFLCVAWIVQPVNQVKAAQGDILSMEFWDTDANGYCDTLRLYIDNTNGTTWTAGTNGSALQAWQDTGFDGLTGDGNDFLSMIRTVNGISFFSAVNANPVIIDVALVEIEWGQNTNLDGFHQLEYIYTPVGLGNGGIEDGVNELGAVPVFDSGASDTEIDKAPPIIRAISYSDQKSFINNGKVDGVFIELTEGVAAGSILRSADLTITNVGDFTGLVAGADTTNYFGSPGTSGSYMAFATEASVIDGFDDSGNFAISTQNSFSLVDSDGNVNNTLGPQSQAVIGDYVRPWLLSFTSTTPDGTYGPGASINITATYSENLGAPSTMTVTLDNGQVVNLNNVAGSALTGTYIVGMTGSAEDTANLTINNKSAESVKDIYTYNPMYSANVQSSSSVPSPPDNIGDTSNIIIDTTAPTVTGVTPNDTILTDSDFGPGMFWLDIDYNENMDLSVKPTVSFIPDVLVSGSLLYQPGASIWLDADTFRARFDVLDVDEEATITNINITGAIDVGGNIQNVYAGGGAGVQIDTKNPTILSTNPADTFIDVQPDTDVVVTFSEAMNTGSVSHTSAPDPGGWSVVWSGGNTIATYSHGNFSYSTTYTEQITAAQDANGNTLVAGPVSNPWSYTTISAGSRSGTATNPTCAVEINNGNKETDRLDVQLEITVISGEALEMLVANDDVFSGVSWKDYHSTLDWTLENTAYGEKEVFVKLRNSAGYMSVTCSDTIEYVETVSEAQSPVCGNGIIEGLEECDDGNVMDGDGCSSICEIEQTEEESFDNYTAQDPEPAGSLPQGVEPGMLITLERPNADIWSTMTEGERQRYYPVYFIDQDNRRHVFPNADVFYSWFGLFSENNIQTISADTMAAIPLGQNITMRPGTYLIKIKSVPKTYAVSNYGVMHWIENEDVARTLYGDGWNDLIKDVNPAFFINYTLGHSLDGTSHQTGAVISYEGDDSVYYIEKGIKRHISESVFLNNKIRNEFVRTQISPNISYPTGTDWPNIPIEILMAIR